MKKPSPWSIRRATRQDLGAVVAMLADDAIGESREIVSNPIDERYAAAFEAIEVDPNQLLCVATDQEGVVGCLQISFIPGLSRAGAWRGQIESVRIASSRRGAGLGKVLVAWAIERCRERNCRLVQLTTDKQRPEAIRFYRALGFEASHEGMKMTLGDPAHSRVPNFE